MRILLVAIIRSHYGRFPNSTLDGGRWRYLDGGAGDDTLIGGGNDTYVVDSTRYSHRKLSEGTDLIQSSVTTTSANRKFNLTGSSNIDATGNFR